MHTQSYIMNKLVIVRNVHFQEITFLQSLDSLIKKLNFEGFSIQTEIDEIFIYNNPNYKNKDKHTIISIGDKNYISNIAYVDRTE